MKGDVVYLFLFLSLLDDDIFASRIPKPNCPNIVLKNGKIKKRQGGRLVKFVCATGYMLSGERYSTCTQGRWDSSPPKCVRPTCVNRVRPPTNGLIYPSHRDAVLHFFCKSGYELKGPSDVYCDGRSWDNNAPTCLPINSTAKLFCDFEDADICGWTPDLNHDFDWRRENYKTPSGSIGTGPSFDHTKGAGQDGYYMYIESSSRNENDTARLISPVYEKTDGETCLEFFYHMFGATTGTLRVYLKKTSENWILDPRKAIFSKSGNQGDKWYRSYHSLGIIGEEYQIIIEGVRGPGYVSDIAIDDVKITENCIYEDEISSTISEIPYSSTEALPTVESCENRCGHKAFGNETLQISCDCDEECYFHTRCCPDYFDFCVLVSTTDDYYTTTDMPNEINPAEHIPTSHITSFPSLPATKRAELFTWTIRESTTVERTTVITKPTTSRKATTKPPYITKPTYIPRITRKKFYPLLPTIQILMPPTTPVVVRKVLPSIKPKPIKPVIRYKESENNDVMEVLKQKNDEQLLINAPLPKDEDNSKKWSDEEENQLNSIYMRNFSESDKLLREKMPEGTHYNIVLIIIAIIGIAVLTTVIAVFLARKYRCSTRRLNYSNGDSQSEIRFFNANDESIDLSWDRGDEL